MTVSKRDVGASPQSAFRSRSASLPDAATSCKQPSRFLDFGRATGMPDASPVAGPDANRPFAKGSDLGTPLRPVLSTQQWAARV